MGALWLGGHPKRANQLEWCITQVFVYLLYLPRVERDAIDTERDIYWITRLSHVKLVSS